MPAFLNKFRQDEDGDMDASPPGEQEKPKVGLAQVTGGTGLDKMLGDWLTSKTAGAAGAAAAPAAGAAAGAGGAAGGLGGLGAMAGGAGGLGSVIPGLTMATMKGAGKAAHQANIPARAGDALADFGRKMQGLPSLNRPDPTDKYGMFGFGLGQALAGIGGGGPAVSGNVDKPDPVSSLSSIVEREGKAGMGGSALAGLSAAGKQPDFSWDNGKWDDSAFGPKAAAVGAAAPRAAVQPKRFQEAPTFTLDDSVNLFAPRPNFSKLPGGEIDLGNAKIGGEFNIDAGPGLGGQVRKGQMQSAINTGDKAGDLAGLLAAGAAIKNAASGSSPGVPQSARTIPSGAPSGMPSPAPSMAPRTIPSGPPSGMPVAPRPVSMGPGLAPRPVSMPPTSGVGTIPGPSPSVRPPPIPPNAPLGPVGGGPGASSAEAQLIAAAVKSGKLPMNPGETLEQAVMRYAEKMGEGGTASAARATGATPQDLLNALMARMNKAAGQEAGTVPMR